MRVAIIGADRPWGARLAAELGAGFEVVALGAGDSRINRLIYSSERH